MPFNLYTNNRLRVLIDSIAEELLGPMVQVAGEGATFLMPCNCLLYCKNWLFLKRYQNDLYGMIRQEHEWGC